MEQGGLLAFASEPTAFWAAGVCAVSAQPDILTDYLAGYKTSDPSAAMVREIRQLPGGRNLVALGSRARVERSWELLQPRAWVAE